MPVTIKVNGVANSLVHKGSNGVSVATLPDVCKTPPRAGWRGTDSLSQYQPIGHVGQGNHDGQGRWWHDDCHQGQRVFDFERR